jgi:hypothetical protein
MTDLIEILPDSLSKASTALIRYPRFNELHEQIGQCQQISRVLGEPQCMSLEGVTGAGKTRLVKTYADSFERVETDEGTIIPVLYVEIPSPATIRDLAQEMLRQLGDPNYDKGTRATMTTRLVGLIKDCCVILVVLDEFQHLIDSQTNHILNQVSNWLKSLIKKSGKPFLVVGIEGMVEIILDANPQLRRLFAVREKLEPFVWDASSDGARKEFSRFVRYAEKAAGRRLTRELSRTDMLYRVHYATDGVVGNVMNLVFNAAISAVEQGRDCIDLPVLSHTFQDRLAKHLRGKVDPFGVDAGKRFSAPVPQPPQEGDNGKGEPSAAQTLTTH